MGKGGSGKGGGWKSKAPGFLLRDCLGVRFRSVFVKGLYLSYHNKDTILFAIDPNYGNLTTRTQARVSSVGMSSGLQKALNPKP